MIIIRIKEVPMQHTTKHFRKRDAILSCVKGTDTHPSADWVYAQLKSQYPDISLGTVYRNLNLLAELGEAIKIITPNGGVHFDGRTEAHYHFTCNCCGNVYDLDLKELECINDAAGKNFDGVITEHSLMFYGICKNCMNQK